MEISPCISQIKLELEKFRGVFHSILYVICWTLLNLLLSDNCCTILTKIKWKKYSPDATVCIAFNSYFWLVDVNDFINIILSKLIYISSISGLLPPGTQFDLFRGTAAMKQDVDDMYATNLGHTIKVSCRCLSSWHYFCIYESDLNLTLENTYTWTCVVSDFFYRQI